MAQRKFVVLDKSAFEGGSFVELDAAKAQADFEATSHNDTRYVAELVTSFEARTEAKEVPIKR